MQQAANDEIKRILNKVFDNSKSLLLSIAPSGWRYSAYVNFFHPTAEQQYEEEKEMAIRLNKIAKKQTHIESFSLNKYHQDNLDNISGDQEVEYVLGLSVYDIFSDNHEIYSRDNRVYNLGSFRGSGRFIADFLNKRSVKGRKYDYLDFYMGTIWIRDRADLLPFYEYIFQILKNEDCDWNYSFPRLHLIDMSNNESNETESPENYKPEESMSNELKRLNEEREIEEFQSELDSSFQKDYEDAKYKPLISVVQAYKNVYNKLPKGHPQKEFE